MWLRKLLVAGLFLLAVQGVSAQENAENLLNLVKGAVVVSGSGDPAQALVLTDGNDASHWSSSTKKHPMPYEFVFELIGPATLTAVGIDGAGARPGGVAGGSAGVVRVQGSAEGPEGGYVELAEFTAEEDGPTEVAVSTTGPVRWLRFTIVSPRNEEASWLYFDQVIARGSVTAPDDTDRFTGVFKTGRKDLVELHQDGSSVMGCFLENGGHSAGTVRGDVVDGVALLSWTSEQGISGPAVLTRGSDGALSGVRYRQKSRRAWGGPVAPEGSVTPCSLPKEGAATPEVEPVDPIVDALETLGVVRLYGIHFNYDSDVPKASATAALERLLSALQAAPQMSVVIQGHTDADGADGYNLDLSARRAASVVGWLVERGVDAARLTPEGKGETQPIASNKSADGKALNRRVEVLRQ